jgi:hypothetical protein
MAVVFNPFTGDLLLIGDYVKKSGDTMTGKLTLSASPIANMEAVTKEYVDSLKDYIDKDATTTIVNEKITTLTLNGSTITFTYGSDSLINQIVLTDSTNTKTVDITRDSVDRISNVDVTIT